MQLSLSRALLGLPCLSVSSVIGRKANLACMRRAAWHEALVRTAKQGARHSDKCSSEKWGCPERSKGGAHICCARQIDVVNSHASSAHHLGAPWKPQKPPWSPAGYQDPGPEALFTEPGVVIGLLLKMATLVRAWHSALKHSAASVVTVVICCEHASTALQKKVACLRRGADDEGVSCGYPLAQLLWGQVVGCLYLPILAQEINACAAPHLQLPVTSRSQRCGRYHKSNILRGCHCCWTST